MLAIVCIAGSCTDEDEYTQGQWMKKASYNGVYRAYASGFTIGNYGYLCGGFYGANKDYLNDLWEYDMSRNSWTQCADMPVAGRKAAVGFAVNGKGYITTGSVKDGSSSYCVAQIPGSMTLPRIPGHGKTTSKVEYAMVPWLSV